MFEMREANSMPQALEKLKYGNVRVNRNWSAFERDGVIMYHGESAVMSETQYAAYAGATEVSMKREQEIYDDTVAELIEEGVI